MLVKESKVTDENILNFLNKEKKLYDKYFVTDDYEKNTNVLSLFEDTDFSVMQDKPMASSMRHHTQRNCYRNTKQLMGASDCDVCTNTFIYEPNEVMGWHTNSDSVGVRVYYTYTYNGESVFRYRDPDTGEIIDSWDIPNVWMRREFVVSKEKPLWHTIATTGWRISYGFRRTPEDEL